MHGKLSIIIPSFNEEKRIKATLDEYYEYFRQYKNTEIIVVLDGCDDQTPNIVKKFSSNHDGIKILEFPQRLGKGGAILKSLPVVQGDFIGYVDADGASKATELMRLVACVESEGLDGAIGSRWIAGAKITRKQKISRQLLSRGLNFLVRLLLRLDFKDTQCGAKVFRRRLIETCLPNINVKTFMFDVNLLYIASKKGFRIREVPLQWKDMSGSKVETRNILQMFWDILKLWLECRGF